MYVFVFFLETPIHPNFMFRFRVFFFRLVVYISSENKFMSYFRFYFSFESENVKRNPKTMKKVYTHEANPSDIFYVAFKLCSLLFCASLEDFHFPSLSKQRREKTNFITNNTQVKEKEGTKTERKMRQIWSEKVVEY